MKKNIDVRKTAQQKKVYLYEIADELGVSEPTFNRWLRKEMTDEKQTEVIAAIENIVKQREGDDNNND